MGASGRPLDMGDPCTPMAWQQRDLNYHQSGYQDRYGPGAASGGARLGPASTSDRLSSHRTERSWRDFSRDSSREYPREPSQPNLVPFGGGAPPQHYPPSRPSYSSGRPPSDDDSSSSSSSSSSSASTEDSDLRRRRRLRRRQEEEEEEAAAAAAAAAASVPHPIYGYCPAGYPSAAGPGYPGTMRSARSVPALALATWDGEPCPVHGAGALALPQGPLLHPLGAPGRRAGSIYDVRLASPPLPPPIYGTLPGRGLLPPERRRSLAAPGAPPGIPPHLLPPMARPLPLVVDEKGGNPEPLPVRKAAAERGGGALPPGAASKAASVALSEAGEAEKDRICCRGGAYVAWVILAVICLGVLLAVMLRFIL